MFCTPILNIDSDIRSIGFLNRIDSDFWTEGAIFFLYLWELGFLVSVGKMRQNQTARSLVGFLVSVVRQF